MFEILKKYKHCGHFDYCPEEDLKDVCNAPTDKSGIYLVWTTEEGADKLLNIGCSGKKEKGVIVHRKCGLGGLKGRLVEGHQFGKIQRRRIWPKKMKELGIAKLSIFWYDTEDDNPVEIEKKLLIKAISSIGTLPPWNNTL